MAMVSTRARAVMISASALFWGGLGYLALTQAPRFITWNPPEGPIITVDPIKKPKSPAVITLPKPDPIMPMKDNVTRDAQAPAPLTKRPTPQILDRTDLSGEALPSRPVSLAPAISTGETLDSITSGPSLILPTTIEPVPVLEPESTSTPEPVLKSTPVVLNPVRLSGSSPEFPMRALERGVEGEVTLAFTVSATGKVESLGIVSESPKGYGFGRAALAAFANWTFQPQTIDGIAIAYPARYTVSFKLED